MVMQITLASKSAIRAQMLRNAGVVFDAVPAPVDERMIKEALIAEGAHSRDIADTLAEIKARKLADKGLAGLIIGSDQVLDLNGTLLSKPKTEEQCLEQLRDLSGKTHRLISAAVVYEEGKPVWRHVTEARLTMRVSTQAYLEDYVARNWESIQHSVGGYKIEEEGVRFFTQVIGDNFTIMGMPLLPLLQYLITRNVLEG